MSWLIRKSPFTSEKEAAVRMLELLSQTAETEGTNLSTSEKEALLGYEDIPQDLRQKTAELIRKTFESESSDQGWNNPRSFSGALEWAGDQSYPNIVAVAEEVACEIAALRPRLQGWHLLKDRLQLVGCGLLVVLLMFIVVTIAGFVFHWR